MNASSKPSRNPGLILPSLCHPHIHLDKPYLLTCNHSSSKSHPDYSDLVPKTGSFGEALSNTAEAKKRYTPEDLYLRGSQLLATSYAQGVTCLRGFVELDHVTQLRPLETGIRLKKEFKEFLDLQICAFAQDPIFSTEHGDENLQILMKALKEFGSSIDVLGTTPYVEEDDRASKKNIQWAIQTAMEYNLHLDFHIEFNLKEGDTMEFFNFIVDQLVDSNWPTNHGAPTIVLGHATRLTLASHEELQQFSNRLRDTKLPIHFVGLPTSDVFMMGRPASDDVSKQDTPLSRQCGTLHVLKMIQEYGLNACLSVNNVGNAFTPYGTGDPLGAANLGVGLFHAGKIDDAKILYEAVSTRAMEAIKPSETSYTERSHVRERKRIDPTLVFKNEDNMEIQSPQGTFMRVPARQRLSIKDIVWDPPETRLRSIIR
ncbi:cytosine deaminase [Fusarium longipes]|uniref:Cytosine deaminase n=1 Tax=Fusarium longipes TaxID=694270 RepID=A0A395SQR1_9HYPO|nr:cytosine deaminase [Fusarium longipes]